MQNAGYVDFDYYNYDFTSPVWDKEIPSLPEAEEMSVYREDYPYMETLEFENAASGTYDADGKTYVNFTSQATVLGERERGRRIYGGQRAPRRRYLSG